MKKIIIVLLGTLLIVSLLSCSNIGVGTDAATVVEKLMVPVLYNPSFGSRAVEFPVMSEGDNLNETGYPPRLITDLSKYCF